MISLSSIAAPPDQPRNEAENFLNLLATLADPERTNRRLDELVAAATTAREEAAALTAAQAALATAQAAKATHDAELAAERKAHDEAIAAERKAWESEKKQAADQVRRGEAEVNQALSRALEHEAKAEQVRLNLEARLARIRDAAA